MTRHVDKMAVTQSNKEKAGVNRVTRDSKHLPLLVGSSSKHDSASLKVKEIRALEGDLYFMARVDRQELFAHCNPFRLNQC